MLRFEAQISGVRSDHSAVVPATKKVKTENNCSKTFETKLTTHEKFHYRAKQWQAPFSLSDKSFKWFFSLSFCSETFFSAEVSRDTDIDSNVVFFSSELFIVCESLRKERDLTLQCKASWLNALVPIWSLKFNWIGPYYSCQLCSDCTLIFQCAG